MDWKDPEIAKQYKAGEYMTGKFAGPLVQQSGVVDAAARGEKLVVLDNAAGTGIVTVRLYEALPADAAKNQLDLTCGDIAEGMLAALNTRIEENKWPNAKAKMVDTLKMDLPSNTFTHVLTNFGLVGTPDPRVSLREMHRVLQPGGTVGLTIWENVGWLAPTATAVRSLGTPDEPGPPFPTWAEFNQKFTNNKEDRWHDKAWWLPEIEKAGFVDVRVERRESVTKHANGRQYCKDFGVMTKVLSEKFWTDQQRERWTGEFEEALVRQFDKQFGKDAEISLDWSAWVVTGKKPE